MRRLGTPCIVHQPSYSIFNRWIEKDRLLDTLESEGLGSVVFSPLSQGMLTDKYLAGVPTGRVIVLSLVSCGAIAALAGLLTSAQLAVGDPTVGPGFLLPAYAAAFLGATAIRPGFFNVWGTLIAIFLVAVPPPFQL